MNRDLCIMACIFCRDEAFRKWMTRDGPSINEARAKEIILGVCGVKSRNDLDTNPEAAARFHELVRRPFLEWKEGRP
ncbi:hypothetical protein K32_48850 [Kaistia sp. 32K]|uniref:hypothetical protein n=1 Tax=Kaistia sp. 32K TaxID=2795690 RepID=UPI00191698CB|nr:hypothetical protein [Kaistia sp. 32K]BCP56268.1 hypothetical protein K32_48850 [Kaistia sp. 32K]